MPVIRAAQSVVHQMHGTSFTSYASPGAGQPGTVRLAD